MNLERFVRALERGQARVARREKNFAAIYERIIRKAASTAARALAADHGLTAAAQPDWQPPPEGVLFTPAGITVALKREQARAAETAIRPALEREGIAWNTDDPLLQDLLAQTESWSGDAIGEAFQPELRKIVADAFADGLSVKDAAALIRSRFAETAPWQAEMLARSNLNMLGNGGMHVAVTRYNQTARATGDKTIETKTWLTAGDSAVRPTHVEAAGQTVPVDQDFQVGGSSLPFPGSPSGALSEILNCRCTAVYGTRARNSLTASVRFSGMRQRVTPTRRAASAAAIPSVGWVSDLAFEGTATGDGRFMLPKSIRTRELPLTLMAMTVTDDGHDGAFVAGRIDKVNRSSSDIDGQKLADGIVSIRGSGIFDMGGTNGAEIARLVGDETLRGVSVDLSILDWAFRDPETGEIIEPEDLTEAQMEKAFWGELQYAVRDAELLAATVCPTPAFADAKIALAASGQQVLRVTTTFELDGEHAPLTASAAGLAPDVPPRDWFFVPEADVLTTLTVTDDGRVFGHIAPWNGCHTGYPNSCVPPPRGGDPCEYFNLGQVKCADGSRVNVGPITFASLHADQSSAYEQTLRHYEDTAVVAADVRAVNGQLGIWVAGALRPTISADQAREFMAASPSGDWRSPKPGMPLELAGIHAVNQPGFPIPRAELTLVASTAHPDGEVVRLVASAWVGEDDFDRRLDVHMARLGGVDALAELIG